MKNLKNVTVRFVDISESSEIESYYVKQSYDNNGSQHMLYTVYSDDGLYRDSDFAKDGLRYNPYLVGETLDETQKNVAEKIASYYGLDADDACDTIIIMPYDEHIKNQIPDIATYLQAKVLADNQNYSINHDVKHNTEDIIMSENKQPLNDIASKSSAFVKSVMEKYPDVLVSLQEEYNKDIGDDVTRFDNTNILDFDGLDEQEMGL